MSLERAQSGSSRSREEIIALNRWGRQWLQAFFAALRTSQVHEANNKIFNETISVFVDVGASILEREGKVEFRAVDDQFYLNGLWIKPTLAERQNLFALADSMRTQGLGGITIRTKTTSEQWRAFLRAYRSVSGSKTEDRHRDLNQALTHEGIEGIEVHRWIRKIEISHADLPLPPVSYALITAYIKVLLSLREFSRCAPGEEQVAAFRRGQRIICELIDMMDKSPRLFFPLSLLKQFDTYFHHHGANTLVLSLTLAKELGMPKRDLSDLGMAALFHDVGKLALPPEILEKPDALTPEEWEIVARHPIESARTFLTLGYLNDSVIERALVGYQHHWATRLADEYPQPRRPMVPSLMSEIVAIAVRYDSLTTDKPYRAGLMPAEAVRLMAAEGGAGAYRADLLTLFLRLLGPLPAGSWVVLEGGEEGMVAASGALAPHPPYPVLFFPERSAENAWVDFSDLTDRPRLAAKRPNPEAIRHAIGQIYLRAQGSPLL